MIFRNLLIPVSVLVASTPVLAAVNVASPATVQALQNLQKLDQQLHEIGYRLATENAQFCQDTIYRSGLLLHDIEQYGDKDAARAVHKFGTPISVSAVTGYISRRVHPGDGLLSINGTELTEVSPDDPELRTEKADYRRLAAINRFIAQSLESRIPFRNSASYAAILRDGEKFHIEFHPRYACASQFQIRPDKKRNASADGKIVTITSALAEYTQSDDELAAIAAHEFAHNLLKHKERLNAQKVNRGFFGQFGKSAGRIKATEIEADRLSVWLMKNAGYDPQAAIRFWTRYGKEHGKGIFSASTHYRWKKRVELFEEEIAKMATASTVERDKYPPPLLDGQNSSLKRSFGEGDRQPKL